MTMKSSDISGVKDLLTSLNDWKTRREAHIGFTLAGQYQEHYFTREERMTLLLLRERYVRRQIDMIVRDLKSLGVIVEDDCDDIDPYADPWVAEDSDGD